MGISERIYYFRKLRGMTQKYLGMLMGFPERSAEVRMAQYEGGARKPKADLTANLAHALEVSPHALTVPEIDTDLGLMHTLFTLEDLYGLTIEEQDACVCLRFDALKSRSASSLNQMLRGWLEQAQKLKSGEITKEEYDRWRYRYPEFDTSMLWAKIPSQELSDCFSAEANLQEEKKV